MLKQAITSVLLLLFISKIQQLSAQSTDTGNWLMYFGNHAINDRWNWHNEIQYRNYNMAGDLEQLLLRTGIGYNLSEGNNNLLIGYGYIHSQPYEADGLHKGRSDEHRIFQQFITRHAVRRVHIQHRVRAEERFFPGAFKARGRYFLSLNIPLNQPTMGKNSLYLSAYNEIFLNARDKLFDRNRVYGGIGFGLHRAIRLEVGMMSQIYAHSLRNQFQIGIYNNLPFY
ncbi:MAG TPA: DUF2490 domain-containing protein [Cyclobacteriaceae bacterium]|nr:DUF2490 domain-containing protein [Cyclobacteriaceae bacterium]